MGFFGRIIRRGARPAPSVDAGDTSSTSASEGGPILTTPSQYRLCLDAGLVKPEESEDPIFLRGSGVGFNLSNSNVKTSGSESRRTRFATLLSRSIGAFGIKRKGKKPRTAQSFSDVMRQEMQLVEKELRSSVNRQLMGQYWQATKRPSLKKRVVLKLHRKHKGEWEHHPECWYYEDCPECGQPTKEGWNEYWTRKCTTCGKYEQVDTIPVRHEKGGFPWIRLRGR